MKRVFLSLIAFSAVVVTAQQEVVQTGTPAILEAANGKKIKVMLQSLKDENLTFQAFKSTKDMTVPASKIKFLQFFPKYDQEAVDASFAAGDFRAVLDVMEPVMADFIEYMPIDNNMRQAFVLVYNSYRFSGDYDNAAAYAEKLVASNDEALVLKGKAGLALVALAKGDVATAEKLSADITEKSEAGGLYLKAEIERAKGDPKQAVQTVTVIIENHANDIEWLPASELLSAYCYLDMAGETNSVISTNSALNTARQVKNMYAGSAVAADAEKLWASLGGAEQQARMDEEKAKMAAAAKERKEQRKAEEKAQREKKAAEKAARQAAEKAAKEAAAQQTDVSTSTETESE
ncbi:hypothetical protein P4B35_12025 [Pontiellaceae bacterium B12227]|nr:hypothetical protein [Pontiellaceae bacterium B12227]